MLTIFDISQNRPEIKGVNLYFLIDIGQCKNAQNRTKSKRVNLYFLVDFGQCQNMDRLTPLFFGRFWPFLTLSKIDQKIKINTFNFLSMLTIFDISQNRPEIKGVNLYFLIDIGQCKNDQNRPKK